VGTGMAEAPDALRCGVVLTNGRGAAEHMLDEGGRIESAQGVLQATAPSAASDCAPPSPLRRERGRHWQVPAGDPPHRARPVAQVLRLSGSDLRTRLQPAALTPAQTRVLASLFAGRTSSIAGKQVFSVNSIAAPASSLQAGVLAITRKAAALATLFIRIDPRGRYAVIVII
jgi:hypothetical protein